ncbi:MAG TPA: GAF domain-containing protein [Blastocatellia bacterium]|nr:GAF domain-containing protein [Blastocatellia bacterium]
MQQTIALGISPSYFHGGENNVTESKKPSQKASAVNSRTRKPAQEPATVPSHKKEFGAEFLTSVVAHIVAPFVLAAASAAWLYFAKDPSVPQWPFLVFVILTIVFAYLSLISLHFFFHKDFVLSRRLNLHFSLLAIFIVTVTAPLAMALSFTTSRTNQLLGQIQKAENDLEVERQAQMTADSKRIQLYALVTDSMTKLLHKPNIDTDDLPDLLHFCIESISLNKPQVHDLRVTVVYLERTRKYLVVPKHGYFGAGFDRDITGLYFNVSQQAEAETDEAYRERIGVAGWSYVKRKSLLDDDVQTTKLGEEHRYKRFQASQKDQADRAMICVGIPDLQDEQTDRYVGILSISSMTPDVFTANDLAVARFFATLLAKFKTPVETPLSVLDVERNSN